MSGYVIENNIWKYVETNWCAKLLGVCISVGRPYTDHSLDSIITLQKHGEPKIVKDCYLTYVDSPLRRFSDFYYIELYATQINCDNINKIISTSCLPVSYLENLVKENVKEYNV